MKKTLIRTRIWSGLYAFEEYKHYKKAIETTAGIKKLKSSEYITPNMGHYPRNEY